MLLNSLHLQYIILQWTYDFTEQQLHGPSMFAVKAKIYGVLYSQASSIAFD